MLKEIKNGVPRVMTAAINKTLKTTQTQAVKAIGQELNLTAKRIKKDFTQEPATWAKTKGALIAKGGPVGLIQYGANRIKAGVSVKVKKTGARSLVAGAFIGRRGTKEHLYRRQYHTGVKKAVVPGRKYAALPNEYRLPVERLTGPRIEDIYGKKAVYGAIVLLSAAKFAENMGKEAAAVLRRFGK
jgi:hypothetical protein